MVGGKLEYLAKLYNYINYENHQDDFIYYGKTSLMLFERYIGLFGYYFNYIENFPDTYSLNGDYKVTETMQYKDDVDYKSHLNLMRLRTDKYIYKYFAGRKGRRVIL